MGHSHYGPVVISAVAYNDCYPRRITYLFFFLIAFYLYWMDTIWPMASFRRTPVVLISSITVRI